MERIYEDGRVYDLMYGAAGRDVEFYVGLAREFCRGCGTRAEGVGRAGEGASRGKWEKVETAVETREAVEEARAGVLELGCGTGRYLIPWAKAGFRAVGIDVSAAMLREAAAKAERKGAAIELHEGDMREFELGERFEMVVIAGNSFCHLKTVEDAERCLNCVRGHVAQGGVLVVDVFVPDVKLLSRDSGGRYAFGAYEDPEDGVRVNVTYSGRYDAARQIQTMAMFYRRVGEEREEEGLLELRMWYPAELEAVLRYNGFVVERRYGGHDGSAFDGRAGKQILVCREGR